MLWGNVQSGWCTLYLGCCRCVWRCLVVWVVCLSFLLFLLIVHSDFAASCVPLRFRPIWDGVFGQLPVWVLAMWHSCLLLLPVSTSPGLGNRWQCIGIRCFVVSMVSCKCCWFVLFLRRLVWSIVSDLSLCSLGLLVACSLLFLLCLVHGSWCLGCLGGKWLCIPLQPFCECWVTTVVIVGWRLLGVLSMWVGQKVEMSCLLIVMCLRWVDNFFLWRSFSW